MLTAVPISNSTPNAVAIAFFSSKPFLLQETSQRKSNTYTATSAPNRLPLRALQDFLPAPAQAQVQARLHSKLRSRPLFRLTSPARLLYQCLRALQDLLPDTAQALIHLHRLVRHDHSLLSPSAGIPPRRCPQAPA